MRATRLLTVGLIVLATPLSRSAAQTCEGTAAFQDGRMRASAFYQNNSQINDVGAELAFGIPRSFYGAITLDQRRFPDAAVGVSPGFTPIGGGAYLGGGVALGHQIHLSDTPFQFCPAVSWHFAQNSANQRISDVGFGGSLGYRVPISDWFTLVPAAGVQWLAASGNGPNQSYDNVFMVMGLVFNRSLTIEPGLVVPSPNGSKSYFTIGVAINWANAVSR
jgi:hypothetical protein